MTTHVPDMIQDEHDDGSGCLRGLLYGKTTDGSVVALKLNADGSFK